MSKSTAFLATTALVLAALTGTAGSATAAAPMAGYCDGPWMAPDVIALRSDAMASVRSVIA
ncbi:hypothetical protein DMH04_13700 [Kibdelosporangium aridum]|uniref:Uncharacterized protein n=1 Tax=Kibdelosporangium aridum TaxID=2030 RepID=A0A428ZDU0_KIBAR|nr:hypothetical protein DMH04_13700 [Kibdelosporangium aridum]